MPHGLLLIPVFLPIIFWAAYHYNKDRHLPEPIGNLALCLLLGVASAAISMGLYISLDVVGLRLDAVALADSNGLALFAYAILAIGPIEEIAKMLPFLLVVMRFRAFDEPMDGLVYASFIGLGYAAVENYHYLDFLTGWEAVARGFAGPVIHILFASIWAWRVTLARLENRPVAVAATLGLLLSAGLHGLYDYLVLRHPVAALPLAATMIAAIWIWRLRLMQRLHEDAVRGSERP